MEARRPAISYLLSRTYELYTSRWKKNALITIPPTILTFLIYYLGTEVSHALRRQILGSKWQNPLALYDSHKIFILGVANGAVQFLYFGLGWILTVLAFAAVANSTIDDKSPEFQDLRDAYSAARERLSRIVRLAVLSYVPMLLGITVVIFGSAQLMIKFVPYKYFSIVGVILTWAGMIAVFSLLSRFGLSIPYLMDHPPTRIREALRASLWLSQGYESYFIVLTSKVLTTAALGYLLGRYVSQELLARGAVGYTTLQWLISGWGIALAVVSEPFLFVGLTVLYLERTRAPQLADASVVATETIAAAPITPR